MDVAGAFATWVAVFVSATIPTAIFAGSPAISDLLLDVAEAASEILWATIWRMSTSPVFSSSSCALFLVGLLPPSVMLERSGIDCFLGLAGGFLSSGLTVSSTTTAAAAATAVSPPLLPPPHSVAFLSRSPPEVSRPASTDGDGVVVSMAASTVGGFL